MEANSHSASQEIPCFMEPEGSLPCSQSLPLVPILGQMSSSSEALCNICNKIFLSWIFVSPSPNPQLKDHPLLAVHNYLFNIFTANLHIWRLSLSSTSEGRAMVWGEGPIFTYWALCLTWIM